MSATELIAYILGGIVIVAGFSYAIYDNFFNKSGTEDKDSLSQNEKTEQQS